LAELADFFLHTHKHTHTIPLETSWLCRKYGAAISRCNGFGMGQFLLVQTGH